MNQQHLDKIAEAITVAINVLQDHIEYDNPDDDEDSAEAVAYDKLMEALELLNKLQESE